MAPVSRSAVCQATPETIWKACFEDMKFENWDPNMMGLSEVNGPCQDGTSFNFDMKSGNLKLPTTLSNTVKNQSLTFSGGLLMNSFKFKGDVVITPQQDDGNKSKIEYTFEVTGALGALANLFINSQNVRGVEDGLANMIKLSEEAQKNQQQGETTTAS